MLPYIWTLHRTTFLRAFSGISHSMNHVASYEEEYLTSNLVENPEQKSIWQKRVMEWLKCRICDYVRETAGIFCAIVRLSIGGVCGIFLRYWRSYSVEGFGKIPIISVLSFIAYQYINRTITIRIIKQSSTPLYACSFDR